MNDIDSKLVERSIYTLLTDYPYYGCLIQQFKIVLSRSEVPTAKVCFDQNGKSIRLVVNPDYFSSLTEGERVALLIHEASHVDRLHLLRLLEGDQEAANKACDLAINCYVPNLPEGALYPKDYGLRNYMPAEWYAARILNEKPPKGGKGGKGGKGQGQGAPSQGQSEEGSGQEQQPSNGGGQQQPDVTEKETAAKSNDPIKKYVPEGRTDVHDWDNHGLSRDEQIDMVETALKRAMEKLGQGADQCPSHVKEALDALKEMRVRNWHKELKVFLGKTVHGWDMERTWSRRNRRYGLQDAGVKTGNGKKLVVAFDTSGSMSQEELRRALAETQDMVKRGVIGTLILFDTQIRESKNLRSVRADSLEIDGGGGTSFVDLMQKVDELRADGLIVFTDMDDSGLCEQPKTPVMWVLTDGERDKYSWGHKVVLDR